MIRLIASDMDGTLLDSRKNMPPRFEDAVRALAARGVRFAVASGRQYECCLLYTSRCVSETDCRENS